MFLRKFRERERVAMGRLTGWAMGQRGPAGELERLYGREHAAELGPLGWLFRAIEMEPLAEPSLGRWQRWESDLRVRLALVPPPRAAFSGFLPPIGLLALVGPTGAQAAVWRAAATAATATVITAHVVTSGALENVLAEIARRPAPVAVVAEEPRPTGDPVLDRLQLNAVALQPGDVNLRALGAWAGSLPHLSM